MKEDILVAKDHGKEHLVFIERATLLGERDDEYTVYMEFLFKVTLLQHVKAKIQVIVIRVTRAILIQ